MKLPEKIQRERKKIGSVPGETRRKNREYQGRPSQNGRTAWHPLNWKKSSH